MVFPYFACMIATANAYRLPPHVLPSIHAVEGGYPGAVHQNTDGTVDMGVMQINTRWVDPLTDFVARKGFRWSKAVVAAHLIYDPCFNIAAAGAILQSYWLADNRDWLRAVGDYHSHTAQLHEDYLLKVSAAAARLFGPR